MRSPLGGVVSTDVHTGGTSLALATQRKTMHWKVRGRAAVSLPLRTAPPLGLWLLYRCGARGVLGLSTHTDFKSPLDDGLERP